MRRNRVSFVGMIIAACAASSAICHQAQAALVVNAQNGSIQATGTGGTQSSTSPGLTPWTESITAGGSEWTGFASTTTQWTEESLEIYANVNIGPGAGQPVWTNGRVMVDIDFTFTETTDTFVRFEFGVGLDETSVTSEFAGHIVDLATGDHVVLSETFAPTTFAPGNYRITVFANLGNLESNPAAFDPTERTSFGGIYVLPTPSTCLMLAGGVAGLAGRRRR